MRLIDANVFIYATGREHVYKEPCLRFLDAVRRGLQEATTDIEVLQEILHFYRNQRDVALGVDLVGSLLTMFPSPLEITVPVLVTAGETLRVHPHLQARDAIHAAVVLEQGLDGIISADRGFDGIPGVTRFDPLEL